jgi:hypothetical protein
MYHVVIFLLHYKTYFDPFSSALTLQSFTILLHNFYPTFLLLLLLLLHLLLLLLLSLIIYFFVPFFFLFFLFSPSIISVAYFCDAAEHVDIPGPTIWKPRHVQYSTVFCNSLLYSTVQHYFRLYSVLFLTLSQ